MLGACRHRDAHLAGATKRADWHNVVTDTDREKLRTWHATWIAAIAKARASGHGAQINALTALFDPDRALPDGAMPPPNQKQNHNNKDGANGPAMQDFTAYPAA